MLVALEVCSTNPATLKMWAGHSCLASQVRSSYHFCFHFSHNILAILGAWGAGTLGQSDWTRYANRKFAPTLSQLIAAPITISVTAIIGIIVTSAAKDVLGEIIWNPIYLLADLQEEYHSSPRSRAGVFFASLGLVSSQLAVSRPNRIYSQLSQIETKWSRYLWF